MSDSIKHIVDTIHVYQKDSYELVEKVNAFYDSAWDRLIIIGTVSFAVVGIVIPLLIQWYQKRTLSLSETQLKQNIKDNIKEEKEKLIEEITNSIENKFIEYEEKIKKMEASATARAFHIQGNNNFSKNLIYNTLADYITACANYIETDNYINLQTLLNEIDKNCLPHVSTEEIEDLKITDGADLMYLINKIDKQDKNGSLLKYTRDIRHKLTKLPKTKKERLELNKPK